MSIKETAYTALKNAGLNVFMPGRAEGIVKEARLIIDDGGKVPLGKTTAAITTWIRVLVPMARPTDADSVAAQVVTALSGVSNMRFTGNISDGYFIEDMEAYGIDVQYESLCTL